MLTTTSDVLASDEPTFTTIDFPGASSTVAQGINPRGDIVGRFGTRRETHGFLLSGGEFTSIDVPGGPFPFTVANGINPRGDIVGSYVDAGFRSHGFLLSGGEFTSFDFPGAFGTGATGINPRGDIVGTYGFRPRHSFLLSGGEFRSIDLPGARDTFANGINPRGDIVGSYVDVGSLARQHGFLLSGDRGEDDDEDAAQKGRSQ